MGSKFKPRQQNKPRNFVVKDMILSQGGKGVPLPNGRGTKREKDYRNTKIDLEDWEDDDSEVPE